jgi:predicted TIM-barrel fold metal-dependent hydrolase
MERMILVSADGHTGGPPEVYADYIDPEYRGALDDLGKENEEWVAMGISQDRFTKEKVALIDPDGAIDSGGLLGAWDMDRRVKELDREGVAAEIVIPGHQLSTLPFFSVVNSPYPADLRAAGARAYHRWLADGIKDSGGRIVGVADAGPCLDMDDAVRELRWVAEHGFRSVSPPGTVYDSALPPIHDSYFEPFWAACAELGLVVTVHGFGIPQLNKSELMKMMTGGGSEGGLDEEERLKEHMSGDRVPGEGLLGDPIMETRRFAWLLMLAGVFDRHPDLKVALTEVRADWVPGTLAALDRWFDRSDVKMAMKPSEYWNRNCYVAPSSTRRSEVDLRNEIGVTRLMFGMDYPHPEGTWPNTLDWIRATFAGVPEAETRLMLGENAIECYELDRDALAKVAERIGPTVAEVGESQSVEPLLVVDFNERSGYANPAEVVDTARLEGLFARDEGILAGRGA